MILEFLRKTSAIHFFVGWFCPGCISYRNIYMFHMMGAWLSTIAAVLNISESNSRWSLKSLVLTFLSDT